MLIITSAFTDTSLQMWPKKKLTVRYYLQAHTQWKATSLVLAHYLYITTFYNLSNQSFLMMSIRKCSVDFVRLGLTYGDTRCNVKI